jgi:hypothetical protein
MAAFSRHAAALDWAKEKAVARFGPIALESPPFDFAETHYYDASMGAGLKKVFYAFQRPIDPTELIEIKLLTNRWEEEYAALRCSKALPSSFGRGAGGEGGAERITQARDSQQSGPHPNPLRAPRSGRGEGTEFSAAGGGKGDRYILPERPEGCCAQNVPVPFSAEPRPLNLDPGYLTLGKLLLASTKDFAHRIYLGRGIYAEVTLQYKHGAWRHHEYTFADYRRADYQRFFSQCREWVKKGGFRDLGI